MEVTGLATHDDRIRQAALALARDWWASYAAFREVGFNETQAMALLQRVIDQEATID
jgi:hypothetical protein